MIRNLKFLSLFILFVTGCAQPIAFPTGNAQTQTGSSSVVGTVYVGSGPAGVDGATVQLKGPVSKSVVTSSGGSYAFTNLPDGEYRVEVTYPGRFFYPHTGSEVDSRVQVSGTVTRNFRSVDFTPSGRVYTIQEIQGRTHLSPLRGQTVTHVVGVVTATELNTYWKLDFPWRGIYIQTYNDDGDPATSEAIRIHVPLQNTNFSVNVGDLIHITSGTVEENRNDYPFLDSGYSGNLSRTQILTNAANVSVLASGLPLPPPVSVGVTPAAGKRIIPPRMVDGAGNIETDTWILDPSKHAIDFWESLEFMRISMTNLKVVEASNKYDDTYVAPDNGAGIDVTSTHGGALLTNYEGESAIIQIQKFTSAFPPTKLGKGGIYASHTGIVDYSRNTYMVRTTAWSGASGGITAQETTSLSGDPHHLLVATKNLENFYSTDSRAGGLANIIKNNMGAPDIVGLQEVQDANGGQDDGTVDGNPTANALKNALNSPTNLYYDFRQIDPVNNMNGGAPGGNIRAALLFRTNRVDFVNRSPGSINPSTTSVQVVPTASGPQLSWSPGLIGAGDSLFDFTRKPLVGEFLFGGKKVFFIVVHLNSKIGDGSFHGPIHPIPRPSESKRHQRALYIANFIRQIRALDPNANVIVVGDFNDFHFSRTLTIFEDAGMYNLHKLNPIGERYSYLHLGHSQTLDHILASPALMTGTPQLDVVRVYRNIPYNASNCLSDHEPVVARVKVQ